MPATHRSTRREQRLRRKAERAGMSIRKSRVRTPHGNDLGGYMLLDHERTSSNAGTIMAGERFDLNLDDLERMLAQPVA